MAPARPPAPSVRFAGYAALFDRADRGGDVIRPGAFSRSLARGRCVPLLSEHDPGAEIGTIECLAEDRRGLRITARVEGEAARALLAGERTGLSFGYRVRGARGRIPVRELTALDLVEVSLVKWPMQPDARVHAALVSDAAGMTSITSAPLITHPSQQGDENEL